MKRPTASPSRVDLFDALAVDRAAATLLRRFFEKNDGAAFRELVALGQPLLDRAARGITHDLGLAVRAEDLISTLLSRLFVDLSPNAWTTWGGNHFLRAATKAMRRIAEERLEELRSRKAVATAIPGWPGAERLPVLARAGRRGARAMAPEPGHPHPLFLSVFSAAFHALERDQRRALIYKDVDGLSYAEIGRKLRCSADAVCDLLLAGREKLARRIANKFRALESDGRRRR